jgi:hypothetical protein
MPAQVPARTRATLLGCSCTHLHDLPRFSIHHRFTEEVHEIEGFVDLQAGKTRSQA